MYPPNPHQGPPRGPMEDLIGGFATTLAAMASMIAAPTFSGATLPYVIWLAEQSYSADLVKLIEIAWMIAAFPFVFFAARAGIAGLLTVTGVYLAYKFI